MKNLENFGVKELNRNEASRVEGGFVPFVLAAIVIAAPILQWSVGRKVAGQP